MNNKLLIALTLGCAVANATTANYDLLGRKGSKMNSPMVYKDVDYSKIKKNNQQKISTSLAKQSNVQGVGLKPGVKAVVGRYRQNGYMFSDCKGKTRGCGESIDLYYGGGNLSNYLSKANAAFINVNPDYKQKLDTSYSYVSAGVSQSNRSGFNVTENPYNMTSSVQQSPYQSNQQIKYEPFGTVNSLLRRVYFETKTNVGVYLNEEAVPVRLNPISDTYAPFIFADNASMNDFNTMPGYEMRASRMYKLLQSFSERSVIYASKGRPSNPASANPQIYLGVNANGGQKSSSYGASAKNLDNYIYNNRTVEVVGAGNTAGNFSAAALAVNAITVGALDPSTKMATSYTAKNDPKYCSNCNSYHKPDVENYSNFYIDDYYRKYESSNYIYEYKPFYDGTEVSAGVTAGMISDMLSTHDFYKWHPEVVKAVMINAKNAKKFDYNYLVTDQKDRDDYHFSYYFVGDVNTLMNTYNDWPVGSVYNEGTRKEIRLNFSKLNLINGGGNTYEVDGFRVAIAWLNSGNDIANLHKLPQNFEIYTYIRTGNPNMSSSITSESSSEFRTTTKDDPYQQGNSYKYTDVEGFSKNDNIGFTVRIVLDEEDSRSENYGQMVLGLDIKPIFKK